MLEAAVVLASVSGLLLIVAGAAWVNLFRGPELQRLNRNAAAKVGNVEVASQLLVVAVGLSAMAAMLGFVGWAVP